MVRYQYDVSGLAVPIRYVLIVRAGGQGAGGGGRGAGGRGQYVE